MGRKKVVGKGKIFQNPNYKLAKFIIDKFVDKRKMNLWRDLPICYKLIKKYPQKMFWQNLPCEFRVPSMTYLTYEKAAEKLKFLYACYSKNLNRDKKILLKPIDLPPILEYKLREAPDLGDNKARERKPKNIIEFCK